jgi:hypothetical protein
VLAGPAAGENRMHKLAIAAAAALAAAHATSAWALTVGVQLTPKALSANHRSFTVTTREVGEFREFNVVATVDREGPALSPFVRGDLSISTPTEHLALVRLEPQRDGRQIRFWFRLAPEAVAGSRFEIGEQAYQLQRKPDGTPVTGEHGQPQFEQIIGGWQYGFLLRDFAETGVTRR